MVTYEIEHTGRLAVFTLFSQGLRVVSASGYLIREDGQSRLYLVSLWEALLEPPQRLGHVALTRFAKHMGANALVPVDHGMSGVPGRVRPAALEGGFVPCRPAVTLAQLEQKLATQVRNAATD